MTERSGGLAYALNANSDAGQPYSTVRIGSADRNLTAGSQLARNSWTHLAATSDGSRQSLFVNGTQVDSQSQPGSLEVSANPLRLRGNTVRSGKCFQALTDGGLERMSDFSFTLALQVIAVTTGRSLAWGASTP